MKKILSIALTFAFLLVYVIPSSAINAPSPKEEVVYGILNRDGSVNNLYVVNIFDGGTITDTHVMGDLYQVVNNNMIANHRIVNSAAINTGLATYSYMVTYHHTS